MKRVSLAQERAVSGLLNGITITYCVGLLENGTTTFVKAFEVSL